jgi:hypothetical protein
LYLRIERKAGQVVLVILLITSLSVGLADTNRGLTIVPAAKGLVIGPVDFVEVFFGAGQSLERRSPRVGEEFVVKARIRNIGPAVIYYLPTLCDSSLSAVFDPSYVRVESGRPRCLAASMPTPLRPGEETTVWAPESGTAYVAIRAGSTTATAVFNCNSDANMEQSTQAEARSTVPLTIEGGPAILPIPGFPIECVILGFALALGFSCVKRRAGQRRIVSDIN